MKRAVRKEEGAASPTCRPAKAAMGRPGGKHCALPCTPGCAGDVRALSRVNLPARPSPSRNASPEHAVM
eukprot:7663050-Prorocentrum_lima.AAC.1